MYNVNYKKGDFLQYYFIVKTSQRHAKQVLNKYEQKV